MAAFDSLPTCTEALPLTDAVAPKCRPRVPEPRMPKPVLASCAHLNWPGPRAAAAAAGPVIFSFATAIPSPWFLGLSTARLGLPIVVSGLGQVRGGFLHVVVTWWPRGGHVTVTWWPRGGNVAATWLLRGDHLVVTWLPRGCC